MTHGHYSATAASESVRNLRKAEQSLVGVGPTDILRGIAEALVGIGHALLAVAGRSDSDRS